MIEQRAEREIKTEERAWEERDRLKTMVERGPMMAAASVGGNQISGQRQMLPICSMEVPSPWETRPPHLFSRKLETAKPTI